MRKWLRALVWAFAGVVVGSIALLFVTAGSELSQATRSACLSHVKELTQASNLYAEDSDGRLPPAAGWADNLVHWSAEEAHGYGCPAMKWPGEEQDRPPFYGYAMNRFLSAAQTKTLVEPEKMHLIYDSSNLARNANEYLPAFPQPPRHHGAIVIAFADGHAKALKVER